MANTDKFLKAKATRGKRRRESEVKEMVFVELPTEEILKKTKELSEQAMHLMREAEKLWLMCRVKVKQTDENTADPKADGNGEN